MSENKEARWYILHTYAGYETIVKANLEQMIENNNLQDQILDIKIPTEQTIEEKNGKKKAVENKTCRAMFSSSSFIPRSCGTC